MVNLRIRGIYSTALTKLLLDNGFRVVQPSEAIRQRFNLMAKAEGDPVNLDIYDRLDWQGVNAVGDEPSLKAFADVLRSALDDAVFRRRFSIYTETDSPDLHTTLELAPEEVTIEAEYLGSARKVRLNVEFPGLSKRRLDALRALVAPTLDGHHCYKACGSRISSLLEMAEKMLERECSRKEVEALFKETVEREYPDEGSRISIEHIKINGSKFDLGSAEVTEFDSKNVQIRLLRTFVRKGFYDGLKTNKDPGDYAVTQMRLGEWSIHTRYFSKDGRYKGTYVNINTPVEMYPTRIRYVDLEADICLWPDGRTQVIDRDKLDEMITKGYVSQKLGQIVNEKTEEILDSLSSDAEKTSF